MDLTSASALPTLDPNIVWNTRDMMDYVLSHKAVPEFLVAIASQWEQGCWDKGLAERVRNSTKKGMSGTFGDVKLLTYAMCGRVLMTLQRDDVSITFICAEDERAQTGVQHINASFNQAQDLVKTVLENWNPDVMEDDVEVRILGT